VGGGVWVPGVQPGVVDLHRSFSALVPPPPPPPTPPPPPPPPHPPPTPPRRPKRPSSPIPLRFGRFFALRCARPPSWLPSTGFASPPTGPLPITSAGGGRRRVELRRDPPPPPHPLFARPAFFRPPWRCAPERCFRAPLCEAPRRLGADPLEAYLSGLRLWPEKKQIQKITPLLPSFPGVDFRISTRQVPFNPKKKKMPLRYGRKWLVLSPPPPPPPCRAQPFCFLWVSLFREALRRRTAPRGSPDLAHLDSALDDSARAAVRRPR